MPEFILDHGTPDTARSLDSLDSLDSFTQGYIEALFFTDEEQLCEESSVAFNTATMESRFVGGNSPGFADLAPDALARIVADCKAFQETNATLLDRACTLGDYDEAAAGRDFWYSRNGHGVGYWDRKELEPHSVEYEALTTEMVAAGHNTAAWSAALAKRKALKSTSLGERLSTAAKAFRGVDSYVGDDGLIYLS